MTFSTLYEVVPPFKSKQNTIKVDRNILQSLITAYKAGRKVNLEDVLKHEFMTVPLLLAKTNGNLHSTNKALLSAVLTQDVHCPASIELDNPCCLIIDGQALVMALGKPSDVKIFGEYANMFVQTVLRMGAQYQRIDVAF